MIAALMLLGAAEPIPRPASDYIAAAKACIVAEAETGLNEQSLSDGGWQRKTAEQDGNSSPFRVFDHANAAPVYITIKDGRADGCTVQADAPVIGGKAALFSALDSEFGAGAPWMPVSQGELRVWKLPHHHILCGYREGRGFWFAVTYVYSGTTK